MKPFVCLGLVALALAIAVPAGASTFLALSRGELVAQSNAVVEGEVLKINSFWSPSGRIIMTEAHLKVSETIMGDAPSVVVLRTFGGTVGGYTVEAHGFPQFAVGEKLLLFLSQRADGTAEVTGYRQGQYRIMSNAAGVELAVPTVEAGVRLLTRQGQAAPRPEAIQLDTLKSQIRAEALRAGRTVN